MSQFNTLMGLIASLKIISLTFVLSSALFCAPVLAHENHGGGGTSDIITVRGRLRILKIDNVSSGRAKSERHFYLEDEVTNEQVELHFPSAAPNELHPGSLVEVRGHKIQSGILVGLDDGSGITQLAAAALVEATGNRATLVLLLESNDAVSSCNANQVTDLMFTNPTASVSGAYSQSSNNTFTFAGQVREHVRIDVNTNGLCNYSAWATQADTAVQQMGIDVSSYASVVYVLPQGSSCGWAGVAYMNGRNSWIRGDYCARAQTYAHELGHNIGMHHAADPGWEYGDYSDPMSGVTSVVQTVNAPHKVQMGWVPGQSLKAIGVGTHTIAALDTNPSSTSLPLVATLVKPDTGEKYYLSYRTPIGYTARIGSGYLNRLNIHRFSGSGLTMFLGAYDVGQVFTDSVNGLSIQVLQSDAGSITFQVSGSCMANAPTLSMSPSVLGGAAGASLTYNFSVKNLDSVYCPSSVFNLSATLPPELSASFSPSSLSIAAGASTVASVTVTSNAQSTGGTYNFAINAIDNTQASHVGSINGQYVIDNIAPSIPTGLTARITKNKIQLSWIASSDNVSVMGYEVERKNVATGVVSIFSSPYSSYLDGAPRGTYTYRVRAYDAAGNRSDFSASITFKK